MEVITNLVVKQEAQVEPEQGGPHPSEVLLGDQEVLKEARGEVKEVKEALVEAAREEKEVLLEVLLEAIGEKEVLPEAIGEKEVLLEAKEVIILKPQWTLEILGKDSKAPQQLLPV